jgi:Protein of unknown function (DUF3990)
VQNFDCHIPVRLAKFKVMAWHNPDIVLYHGTTFSAAQNVQSIGIQSSYFKPRTDFGPGFYTTTNFVQATQMAKRRIALARVRNQSIQGAILTYTVKRDDLAKLETLYFVRPEAGHKDLWDFIQECRKGTLTHRTQPNNGSGYFDVVVGPVAQNWQFPPFACYPEFDQISFHTLRAFSLLTAPTLTKV